MTICKWVFFCALIFSLAGCSSDRDLQAKVDSLEQRVVKMEGQIAVFLVGLDALEASSDEMRKATGAVIMKQQQMLNKALEAQLEELREGNKD